MYGIMARLQHLFESPSSFDACTNANIKVVYNREIRSGANMSGAFCLHRKINPGEFICAWNGRQIVDDDAVEGLTNIYDLTKYALSFPSGKGKQLIYSSPRLDKFGRPMPLPEREEDVVDPRDVSLAVFLNEPSPNEVALYDAKSDTVRIVPKTRNTANVCLRTEKQRNGVVCPLMFASRVISPGEELVWDYGAEDYDRRFYNIDEDAEIFEVLPNKYSATEAPKNSCRLTCESVAFRQGLSLESFSPDMFLLDSHLLDDVDRRRVLFRSDRYLPARRILDQSTTADTASVVSSDPIDEPMPKRQKRRGRLQRRTVTVESMMEDEMHMFVQERRELDQFANEILQRLRNVRQGRIRDSNKIRVIEILKRILLPAVYRPYDDMTPRGIAMHFPRVEFVLTKVDGNEFIQRDNDVMWKDILKMQHMVFLAVDSVIDSVRRAKDSSRDIHLKFDPNVFTSIYLRPDGSRETVDDWNTPEFRAEHPTANKIGMRLLRQLSLIQDSVRHFDSWHRMLEVFESSPPRGGPDVSILWQRGREFGELALTMLEQNVYERINDSIFWEMSYTIMKTIVDAIQKRPIDAISASRTIDVERGRLHELQRSGNSEDASLAANMLEVLREPKIWRSESMLMLISRPDQAA